MKKLSIIGRDYHTEEHVVGFLNAGDRAKFFGKLATGATWTRDEVGRGFDALGHALNEPGHKIGAKQQAAPVKSGL
ncbi:MAG: hypothetical protein ACYCTY_11510 [Sulfuricella sp.]